MSLICSNVLGVILINISGQKARDLAMLKATLILLPTSLPHGGLPSFTEIYQCCGVAWPLAPAVVAQHPDCVPFFFSLFPDTSPLETWSKSTSCILDHPIQDPGH